MSANVKEPSKRFSKATFLQIIFIVIIVYAVSCINILLIAMAIVPSIPYAYLRPGMINAFAATAFALTTFLSIFHIFTMVRRQRRRTDLEEAAG